MKILSTAAEVRALLDAPRRENRRIGFVPTMGALHDGHLSLIRRARAETDVVVLSVFVNPMQFTDTNDLADYPRTLTRDAEVAEAAGADVVFAPEAIEIYPPGFQTVVEVRELSEPLEGLIRGPAHFAGVTTVVAKLFNIVQPSVAYFGQKDAQQVLIVQRMVRDLGFPLRIDVCPTVREPDGLAMSSRNTRLDPQSRARAIALKEALDVADRMIAAGEHDVAAIKTAAIRRMADFSVEPEYFAILSTDLNPVTSISSGLLIAVAARVGGVRLIDNILIGAVDSPTP